MIGLFVNTVAVRMKRLRDDSFRSYLLRVRDLVLDAIDNQDYQFSDLVNKLNINRDVARNPVFDVMFNMLNANTLTSTNSPIEEPSHGHMPSSSKFDLTLTAVDVGSMIRIEFEYRTALFNSATIDRIIGYFKNIVLVVIDNLEIQLSEINILPPVERHQLLQDFSGASSTSSCEGTFGGSLRA
jgi:non-ribosomal peptide synthetase component F